MLAPATTLPAIPSTIASQRTVSDATGTSCRLQPTSGDYAVSLSTAAPSVSSVLCRTNPAWVQYTDGLPAEPTAMVSCSAVLRQEHFIATVYVIRSTCEPPCCCRFVAIIARDLKVSRSPSQGVIAIHRNLILRFSARLQSRHVVAVRLTIFQEKVKGRNSNPDKCYEPAVFESAVSVHPSPSHL